MYGRFRVRRVDVNGEHSLREFTQQCFSESLHESITRQVSSAMTSTPLVIRLTRDGRGVTVLFHEYPFTLDFFL